MSVFERLLPAKIDNVFRGPRAALWLFVLVLIVRTAISAGSMFNSHQALQQADGVPIDTYGEAGAQAAVALFGALGESLLALSVVGWVAVIRYRAAVPLMFVVLLAEHAARRAMLLWHPIAKTPAPSGMINLVLISVTILGVVLSLMPSRSAPPTA